MRHLLLILAILTLTGCAVVDYGPPKRTKTSLPPNLLAQLPLLNIGEPHGDRYLTPKYDGMVREGSGGDTDVEVHYLFHGTEDRLIGFDLYFYDATFPACVKAIADRFGPPSETSSRPLMKWNMAQDKANHIAVWHTPNGDLTAVEYRDYLWNGSEWPGEIKLESKELVDIRRVWERKHGFTFEDTISPVQ